MDWHERLKAHRDPIRASCPLIFEKWHLTDAPAGTYKFQGFSVAGDFDLPGAPR